MRVPDGLHPLDQSLAVALDWLQRLRISDQIVQFVGIDLQIIESFLVVAREYVLVAIGADHAMALTELATYADAFTEYAFANGG